MPRVDRRICIDLEIKEFATLSDGTKIENPKWLSKAEKRIKKVQRELLRKQKDSKNYEKTRLCLEAPTSIGGGAYLSVYFSEFFNCLIQGSIEHFCKLFYVIVHRPDVEESLAVRYFRYDESLHTDCMVEFTHFDQLHSPCTHLGCNYSINR